MSVFGGKVKIGPKWDPGKTIDEAVDQGKKSPGEIYDKYTSGDAGGAARQALDPARAGANIQGAHNTNMGHVSNAWHTSVTDPVNDLAKQAKDFFGGAGGGGGAGSIPQLGQLPQVTAPGAAPIIKAPTAGFAVPTLTGQQIGFSDNGQYDNGAGVARASLMQQLAAQSRGQGPSVAEAQLKQAQEANMAAVMAQLASARGGANPLAQRQAMVTSADIQAQTARDAATARLQEQLAAQGLLGQVANNAAGQGLTARGQDIGLATDQAKLMQDAAGAQFNAGVDSNKTLFLAQQQAGMAQADLTAKYAAMGMDAQKAQQMAALEIERLKVAAASGDQAAKNQLLGGLMSGAGTVLGAYFGGPAGAAAGGAAGGTLANSMGGQSSAPANPYQSNVGGISGDDRDTYESQSTFVGPPTSASQFGNAEYGDFRPAIDGGALKDPHSDETLKTNITDGSDKLAEMLSALSASEYEYKDEKHGPGKHIGPMAQELLRSEAGSRLVYRADDGLKVDASRSAMAALSAAAMLQERIKKLEKKGH